MPEPNDISLDDLPDDTRYGAYYNLPVAEYDAAPALRSTSIRLLMKSPAHYLANHRVETEAMKTGSLVHAAMLEPEVFGSRYMVMEKVDRRYKEGKVKYEDALRQAQEQKLILINEADQRQVFGIRASLLGHKRISKLLTQAKREVSLFWNEEDVSCKARIDILPVIDNTIVDLKTTEDAQPKPFMRSVYRYGYNFQAGHYCRGGERILGMERPDFLLVAIEKEPPYAVAMYTLPRSIIEEGWRQCAAAMEVYRKCLATKEWPGYTEETLELHDWKTAKEAMKDEQ